MSRLNMLYGAFAAAAENEIGKYLRWPQDLCGRMAAVWPPHGRRDLFYL